MFAYVTIAGRLSRDADAKPTKGGKPMLRFSIPVVSGKGDFERTSWFNVTAFGELAQRFAGLRKGATVIVDGPISLSTYQQKDGAERSRLEVMANGVRDLAKQGERDGAKGCGPPDDGPPPPSDEDIPY